MSEERRTMHWWWAVAVTAFVIYGSLYPFEFVYPAPSSAWRQFLALRPDDLHLGDVLANLLLFVPLGLVVARTCRTRGRGLTAALATGLVLGIGLQLLQAFVPARVPSLWDAGWNTAGAVAGALVPMPAVPRGRYLPARARSASALLLIAVWLLVETFPFIPTLDWQALKNALKPLLLAPQLQPLALLANLMGWAALAHLWRHGARLPLPRAGPLAALVIALAAQVVVVQRAPSLSGVVGGFAGVLLALLPASAGRQARALLALLVIWLVVSALEPMSFRESPASFHWLPLAGFLGGSMLHGTWIALEKLFWFGLFLELMLSIRWPWGPATLFGIVLIGGLEWAQRWVAAAHVAEITDPLMFAGLALAWRWLAHNGDGAVPGVGQSREPGGASEHDVAR